MSKYGMKAVEFGLKYRPMGIEKRRSMLPYKNVSSLYPAKTDEDVLVTANGRQRIDIVGSVSRAGDLPPGEDYGYALERYAGAAGCGTCDTGGKEIPEGGKI